MVGGVDMEINLQAGPGDANVVLTPVGG